MPLGDDVIDYLFKRFEPSMAALRPVIDLLGDISLSEQRRLTVPLVRSVFERAGTAPEADGASGAEPSAAPPLGPPTLRPI